MFEKSRYFHIMAHNNYYTQLLCVMKMYMNIVEYIFLKNQIIFGTATSKYCNISVTFKLNMNTEVTII